MNKTIRVIRTVDGTSVDGPGLRTSIYFAGCAHACPGCHNPQSWDFMAGEETTVDELVRRIKENDFNVTFTGGDPLYHAEALIPLAKSIINIGKDIWIYTGFTFEEILEEGDQFKIELLQMAHVLVDGPFIQKLRDPDLLFRGSSNQRLIDLPKTFAAKSIVNY